MSSIKTELVKVDEYSATHIDFGNGVTALLDKDSPNRLVLCGSCLSKQYDPTRPLTPTDNATIEMLLHGWSDVFDFYIQLRAALTAKPTEPEPPVKVKRQRKVKAPETAKPEHKAAPQVRNRDWWDAWQPREPNTCKSLAKAKTLDDFAKFRDEIQVEFTAGYKNVSCLTAPKKLHCPRFDSDADRMDAIKNLVATHPDEFSANLVKESRKALIALELLRGDARYLAECKEPMPQNDGWHRSMQSQTPSYLTYTSKGMYMGIKIKDAPSHKGLDAIPA